MPDGNGTNRLDRIEKQLERIVEIMDRVIEYAALTDQRIELLRSTQLQTNESVRSLVGAIRDLIDRIPSRSGTISPNLIAY